MKIPLEKSWPRNRRGFSLSLRAAQMETESSPSGVRGGSPSRICVFSGVQRMWFWPSQPSESLGLPQFHFATQGRQSSLLETPGWDIMGLLLVGTLFVFLGVSGSASPSAESSLSPRDAARVVVETYNQGTDTPAVFKLLKFRSTRKTRFDWGVHFSMNFTIKETGCQKTMTSYKPGECRYKPAGEVKECLAEVSFLNFMQDTSPLTSVQCTPLQRASGGKPGPHSAPAVPRIHVEHYRPSAYITAAQVTMEAD
ncbi:cathelicidin-2-like isoform X2 [Paroedura picta]|uniref:cathelicidin-2-like isoform X2 n=1 Tax=Paroedura picta TaxID=143630 RepID=UPI0040570C49